MSTKLSKYIYFIFENAYGFCVRFQFYIIPFSYSNRRALVEFVPFGQAGAESISLFATMQFINYVHSALHDYASNLGFKWKYSTDEMSFVDDFIERKSAKKRYSKRNIYVIQWLFHIVKLQKIQLPNLIVFWKFVILLTSTNLDPYQSYGMYLYLVLKK